MTHKINLHTHSTFSDGANTPEEMVLSAIEKGFTILGFSDHSLHPLSSEFYTADDRDWHMSPAKFSEYVTEINRLKEKYSGKIQLVLGFEADYFEDKKIGSAIPLYKNYKTFSPDYLIGSVHFVNTPLGFYTVDHTADEVQKNLIKLYTDSKTGKIDYKKAVCEYFETEREMISKGNFQILGHADLIRKRNGVLNFFNEEETWYKEQIRLTVDKIAETEIIVELNTGGMTRKCLNDVYPSAYFLDLLHSKNIPVCVNSDCHNINDIDAHFNYAYEAARKAGYKELVYPTVKETFIIKL